MKKVDTIDEYIGTFPKSVQDTLEKIRQTIRQAAPEAQEKISYGLATFTLHGNLVHFGAYDTHIGFYPGSSPIKAFKKNLESYETSKGTIRLPLDKPVPLPLITKIVKFRVKENLQRKKKKYS
jgi:uncharacterized protein YdhG (YjbR/CyaY superfamily)